MLVGYQEIIKCISDITVEDMIIMVALFIIRDRKLFHVRVMLTLTTTIRDTEKQGITVLLILTVLLKEIEIESIRRPEILAWPLRLPADKKLRRQEEIIVIEEITLLTIEHRRRREPNQPTGTITQMEEIPAPIRTIQGRNLQGRPLRIPERNQTDQQVLTVITIDKITIGKIIADKITTGKTTADKITADKNK
jgi:hypothetical protein